MRKEYGMKILILSAATGGGHLRASRAISNYIRQNDPECEVEVVDAMKSIGSLLDKTVCDGYHTLATKTPKLFGKLYRATNKKSPLFDLMNRFSNTFSRLLLPTIEECAPDAIISTHPFVSEMVSHLKAVGCRQCAAHHPHDGLRPAPRVDCGATWTPMSSRTRT